MSVTEITAAIGEWSVTLKDTTPIEVLDALDYFGHVAVTPARIDPIAAGDALLRDARYVGVLRDRNFKAENKEIKGAGMAFWLGDEDDKGEVIETPMAFAGATFSHTINTLLPSSVQPGLIYAQNGLYNGQHVYTSRRKALDYVCSLYNCEWRANGDGTVDAGAIDELYVSDPKAAILRKRSGSELTYKAFRGAAELAADTKDFTTRVMLLAEGQEASTVTATADIAPEKNPYKNLFGGPLKLTRVVSEQQTSEGNAQARAQLQLNRFTSPREAISLTTDEFDIKGDVGPGDYVWVYDPEAKLIDETNQIDFHGQEIYPLKLRITQMSWPIIQGMGVSYRDRDGNWFDITDYVVFETGVTEVVVGGYNRSLTGSGTGPVQDPGSRPVENSTIPGVPVWNTPFSQSTYQSDLDGLTRAQVVLSWDQPLNTDGSIIQDGFLYEIRYRTSQTSIYIPTHDELSQYRHNQLLGTFAQPIAYTQGAWQYTQVSWDNLEMLLMDLTPGIPYDFQIRALDTGTPPNYSEWSENVTIQTRPDTQAPSTPAAVQVVAGSRNAVQVVHTLGKAEGGTYNLEGDLNHLQIHGAFTEDYITDARPVAEGGTLLGRLQANQAMMRGRIPAVGTFQLDEMPDTPRWVKVVAVDNFGNESEPSAPMQQTADLIDSAFISELTVSRVSAGTVTATWIQAGEFKTGDTGARVVWGWYGIEAYNQDNLRTLDVDSTTGEITLTGTIQSGITGRRITIEGGANEIKFFPEVGETRFARLYSYIPSNFPNDIAVELRSIDSDTSDYGVRLWMLPDAASIATMPQGEGGDLLSASFMRVDIDQAQIAASTRNKSSPPYTSANEIVRARVIAHNSAHARMEVNGATGTRRARVRTDDTATYPVTAEVMNGDTRDGGYFWFARGAAVTSYLGHYGGGRDDFIAFDPDQLRFTHSARHRFFAGGNWAFDANPNGIAVNGTVTGTSGAAGVDYRVNLKAASGGDVFFYWASGQLNIGSGGAFIKTFVIEHPDIAERYLVHATTESPHAGVEYWGEAVVRDHVAIVQLPDYFESLVEIENRPIFLTPVLEDDSDKDPIMDEGWGVQREEPILQPGVPAWARICKVASSPIRSGKFKVYCDGPDGTKVGWLVKAVRKDAQFEVEPLRSEGELQNVGPYSWLER